MNIKNTTKNQMYSRGAVSLFVVIFTSLLFVTITVGFTILMLSNQRQSIDNDLSQSALDSAQAGTEDAKRVLAKLADCEERADTGIDCTRIKQAVDSQECDTVNKAIDITANTERLVKQSDNPNDEKLEQAYTCVRINTDTNSYIGKTKGEDEIRVIPLRSADSFEYVRVSWLIPDDMDLPDGTSINLDLNEHENNTGAGESSTVALPDKEQWIDEHRGAMLRLQTMQYQPGDVNLEEMDESQRTVFLYPNEIYNSNPRPASLPASEFLDSVIDLELVDKHDPITPTDHTADGGMTHLDVNAPQMVVCDDSSTSDYMCKTDIIMPDAPSGSFAYLTLASFYRETSFKVELINSSGDVVNFNNVQPEIDVTGRANDVFRRIVSRVEAADANQAPYPRAEFGTSASMCKNFVVTDDPDDFHDYTTSAGTSCPDIENLTEPSLP